MYSVLPTYISWVASSMIPCDGRIMENLPFSLSIANPIQADVNTLCWIQLQNDKEHGTCRRDLKDFSSFMLLEAYGSVPYIDNSTALLDILQIAKCRLKC